MKLRELLEASTQLIPGTDEMKKLFRAVEREHVAATRVRIEPIDESGDDAGGEVAERKWQLVMRDFGRQALGVHRQLMLDPTEGVIRRLRLHDGNGLPVQRIGGNRPALLRHRVW